MTKPHISIIKGTHEPRDLINAFIEAARVHAPLAYEALTVAPFGIVPAYAQEDPDSEWWSSQDAQDTLAQLIEALTEHGPDRCYFGTDRNEADHYGWWYEEKLFAKVSIQSYCESTDEFEYDYTTPKGTFRHCVTGTELAQHVEERKKGAPLDFINCRRFLLADIHIAHFRDCPGDLVGREDEVYSTLID